jgi:hypothetical protein
LGRRDHAESKNGKRHEMRSGEKAKRVIRHRKCSSKKNYLEFANRRSSYAGQTESAGSFRTTSVNCMRFQKALQNASLTLPPSEHYLAFSSSFIVQPLTVNCFPNCGG